MSVFKNAILISLLKKETTLITYLKSAKRKTFGVFYLYIYFIHYFNLNLHNLIKIKKYFRDVFKFKNRKIRKKQQETQKEIKS